MCSCVGVVMNAQQQLQELERVAQILAVKVCYEPMAGLVQGVGGLCRLRGEYRVIIDKKLRAPERVNILVDALRRFDLSAVEMGAALRRVLVRGPAVAESIEAVG